MPTSNAPIDRIFYGTFIHSQSLKEIEYIKHGLLFIDATGTIVRIERNVPFGALDSYLGDIPRDKVVSLTDSQFIIPGFVDTHIHASQYSYCGNGHDIPLLQWLDTLTFPYESEFKDPAHARHVYQKSVARTLRNGTTSSCYFATIHLNACKELVSVIQEQGQRAFVGKVNMDQNSPDILIETTASSIADTRAFIEHVQAINARRANTTTASPLITPIITPRFAISCTSNLLARLGELAEEYMVPIQSHLCETLSEIEFTCSLFPESANYTSIYADHGLLNKRTIMAHCVHMTHPELEMMKDRKAGVSHCPNSNFTIKSGMANVRAMLDMDIKVSLGTDVAGGYSPSILEAIRTARTCSVALNPERALLVSELFFLATMGGARVMGLEDTIGNFVVGKEFDAVLVDTTVENSSLDWFEHDTIESMFDKYLFMGDDRNNTHVFVQDENSLILTPSQEHYLKKYLFGSLIHNELVRLQKDPHGTLPNLGGPFDLLDQHAESTTPFLRYLFESIVVPFPFLTSTKGELWPKLQTFMDEWAKIEAGNGVEREEMLRRKRLKKRGEKTLVLLYSMSVKSVEQRAQEEREQGGDFLDSAFDQLRLEGRDQLSPSLSCDSHSDAKPALATVVSGVRMNVVAVRVIKEKRHVREHEHSEFLVSSTLRDGREFIVARRHGRFRRLYTSLRQEYPQYEFPLPPPKYETKSGSSASKAAREKDRVSLRGYLHELANTAPEIVTCSLFVNFLTKDAITLTPEEQRDVQMRATLDENRLAQQELFDREVAKKVEELDKHLKEVKTELLQPGGVARLFDAFKKCETVEDLPPMYQTVFEWACMNFASTLYHVFSSSDSATLNFTHLKRTHLLMPYRTIWGLLKVSNPIAMMKGILDLFLAQPFGRRSLMQRIISVNIQEEITEYKNDIEQIKASIGDHTLCDKIYNYVQAPKTVVSAIFPNDEPYDITELSLVLDVLQSDKIQPVLQPQQILRVLDSKKKLDFEEYQKERRAKQQTFVDQDLSDQSDLSDSDYSGTKSSSNNSDQKHKLRSPLRPTLSRTHSMPHPELNLVRQLQQLLVTHLRIQDKERMMALVFQGVTGEIFKELISIFYQPLAQVYKSANVADSLMDVKDFSDELIKIVEQSDDNEADAQATNGRPTTATLYLNLVKKHLPSFYKFVHSVHKQDDGLFHDLLEWIESILNFMRTGYARPPINYTTGKERRVAVDMKALIRQHVAPSQWNQIRKEAENMAAYYSQLKDKKQEQVRKMAGLDRTTLLSSEYQKRAKERERVAQELMGMGLLQEDVDELELLHFEGNGEGHAQSSDDDEYEEGGGQGRTKMPTVPVIDTLKRPFVELMDKAVFQSARE
ncbi:hypothetical protein BG004_003579 [Podila humilis]|nr:hypothetical protein BG004_003579 [Podila humilis]